MLTWSRCGNSAWQSLRPGLLPSAAWRLHQVVRTEVDRAVGPGPEGRAWSPEDEQPGPLVWLQAWFGAQCNGDWEHSEGVSISSLDNPGWRVQIHLAGTALQGRAYSRSEVSHAEHDWCWTWVEHDVFHAACGPLNLGEAIHTFRQWVQSVD